MYLDETEIEDCTDNYCEDWALYEDCKRNMYSQNDIRTSEQYDYLIHDIVTRLKL